MATVTMTLQEDYWDNFEPREEDIEFIYNHLLEIETPQTTDELVEALVDDRIQREKIAIEKKRTSGGDLYQPKGTFKIGRTLVFPAFNWQHGEVTGVHSGQNPDLGKFKVLQVAFDSGETREFASDLDEHILNEPPTFEEDYPSLNQAAVLQDYASLITTRLDEELSTNPDFVRIASKWFPRALLVDISEGHLNIAEAVLDMSQGGPLPTAELLEQVELNTSVNPKLLEFSLDLALQEDKRFDEVGPSGDVLWFLKRLEPEAVLDTPVYLRYEEVDYDRSLLSDQMLNLERELDDELSPDSGEPKHLDDVEIRLIYPHWRAGTLPLSNRIQHLFPTAYEAPRIQFTLVDGNSSEHINAWVVREKLFVYGLKEWYESQDLIPGSIIHVERGQNPGEVIINSGSRRTIREWVRTVLVGSDGGVVYAMLKQLVSGQIDDRMGIAVPDPDALDQVWLQKRKDQLPFEQVVVNTVKELTKLNPQGHVHASELYAAVNITRRTPPGPVLALLASRPWFIHVGDLHYRLSDQDI